MGEDDGGSGRDLKGVVTAVAAVANAFKRSGRPAKPGGFYRPRRVRRPSLVDQMGVAGGAQGQMESGRRVLTKEDGELPPEVLKLLWSDAIAVRVRWRRATVAAATP